MAIQYVGGTTGTGTGATSYSVSLSGTLTGGLASSPSPGDLIVVFTGFGNNAAAAPTCSGNTSGTYISTVTAVHQNDTWDTEFGVFHQFAGSTPDTTLTIGRTNNLLGGATVVLVFRGTRGVATSPAASTTGGSNTNVVNPPSITPTEAGSWVVAGGTGLVPPAQTSGHTAISNLTLVRNAYSNNTTADASTIAGYYDGWTSGAFDPAAASGAVDSGSASWAAASLVLLPDAPALSTKTDNFDANSSLENTKWNTSVDGTGTVTNTGGEAVLTPESTNGFGVVLYGDATNDGRWTLTSDGAYVKVVKRLKTANTAASGFSIFRIYDWSKGLTNTFVQFNITTNNELLAQTVSAGTLTQTQTISTTWDADNTPWLRIAIDAGTVKWYTASGSSTPGTWTERHTNEPPAVASLFKDCQPWFQSYNDNWATTGARVDAFTIDGFNTSANSTGTDVALTGQSVTVSRENALVVGHENALTGHGLTSARDVLTPNNAIELTGHGLTSARDTLTPLIVYEAALTGHGLTVASDTFGVTHENALTGHDLTVARGTVFEGLAVDLTGQAATVARGDVGVTHENALTGQAVTSARGSFGVEHENALTGQAATVSRDTVTPSSETVVALTGHGLTSARGDFGVEHTNALTGQSLTSARGTLTPTLDPQVALTGQAVTASRGSMGVTHTNALTSQLLTVHRGTASVSASSQPTPIDAQAAVNAATAGTVLDMTNRTYTGSLLVNKALTIKGLIITGNTTQATVRVTASNVTLERLTVTGPQFASYNSAQIGVHVTGTSSARISGLTIIDCTISDYGNAGIQTEYTTDLLIQRNLIEDTVYAGMMILSATGGTITRNIVRRIGVFGSATQSGNAYAIALSQNSGGARCQDVDVHENVVDDVPTWHGLDTHSGLRIAFTNNIVRDCYRAVFLTSGNADCYVNNNRMECPASNDRWAVQVVSATVATITNNNMIGWPQGTTVLIVSSTGVVTTGNFNNSGAAAPFDESLAGPTPTGGVPPDQGEADYLLDQTSDYLLDHAGSRLSAFGEGPALSATGLSVTVSRGTMVPQNAVVLQGHALAVGRGTPVLDTSDFKTLVGHGMTASRGTVVPTKQVPLTGHSMTTARGTVNISITGGVTGPASVFTTGAQGFWLDSTPITQFQTFSSDGTDLTAYADDATYTSALWGLWKDASGNNNHAVQPDQFSRGAALNPVANPWRFYGNIYEDVTVPNAGGSTSAFYFAAALSLGEYYGTVFSDQTTPTAANGFRIYHNADGDGTNAKIGFCANGKAYSASTAVPSAGWHTINTGDQVVLNTGASAFVNASHNNLMVVEFWYDGAKLYGRINGGTIVTSTNTVSVVAGSTTCYLNSNVGTDYVNGGMNLYEVVMAKNHLPSQADRDFIRGYLTDRVQSGGARPLTGHGLTVSRGSPVVATDQISVATGQQATVSRGTVSPALAVALSGLGATTSNGTLTPVAESVPQTNVALSGLGMNTAYGTLTPPVQVPVVTVNLSGHLLTMARGELTAPIGWTQVQPTTTGGWTSANTSQTPGWSSTGTGSSTQWTS